MYRGDIMEKLMNRKERKGEREKFSPSLLLPFTLL
jgi:hypothetical protein